MKKLISIWIVFLTLSLTYSQVYGKEEFVGITTHLYGANGIKEMKIEVSLKKAEEIKHDLGELRNSIENNDKKTALEIISNLKKDGIFNDEVYEFIKKFVKDDYMNQNSYDANLTNLMCFVVGYGKGIFVYPLDLLMIFLIVAVLGWMPLGILLVFFYSIIWLFTSHLIPFRFIMPLTLFGLSEGNITTVGLKGTNYFQPKNETTMGILLGFIGVIINIFIPPKEGREELTPFFCMGYSVGAMELIKE